MAVNSEGVEIGKFLSFEEIVAIEKRRAKAEKVIEKPAPEIIEEKAEVNRPPAPRGRKKKDS